MSFSSLEKTIHNTEAIRNYDSTLEENAALRAEISRLARAMLEQKDTYSKKNAALETRVAKLEGLRVKYDARTYSLEELDVLVDVKVKSECQHSIDTSVAERWKRESPQLVQTALRKELDGYSSGRCSAETRAAVESCGMKRSEEILKEPTLWPPWFRTQIRSHIDNGVGKGLNDEFKKRVNAQAAKEIARLVGIEWPSFVQDKITPQFQGTLTQLLVKLRTSVIVPCDRCGKSWQVDVTPELITRLIKEPFVPFRCADPNCKDLFIIPHHFPLNLGQVIYSILGSGINSRNN